MPTASVIILAAMELEARAVRRHLRPGTPVQVIGIAASRLDGVPPPAAGAVVLMVGVAGAIEPSLAVGDVVLDDPARRVPTSVDVRRGRVHTAADVVATPADKAALFARTGAVVVDMEQAAVRGWAESHGAVVVGLRAVSDTAAQVLDPAVRRLVNDVGRPRPSAVAAELCRRPSFLPYLIRLGWHTNAALANLGPVVRRVCDAVDR